MKLSEIIPVYNKAETRSKLNKKVESIPIQKQITVVDDYWWYNSDHMLNPLENLIINKIELSWKNCVIFKLHVNLKDIAYYEKNIILNYYILSHALHGH